MFKQLIFRTILLCADSYTDSLMLSNI